MGLHRSWTPITLTNIKCATPRFIQTIKLQQQLWHMGRNGCMTMNHKMMDLCHIHDTQKLWTCLLSDSKVDRQLWAHLCISWICHDFSWWYAVSKTTTITWLILFLRCKIEHQFASPLLTIAPRYHLDMCTQCMHQKMLFRCSPDAVR